MSQYKEFTYCCDTLKQKVDESRGIHHAGLSLLMISNCETNEETNIGIVYKATNKDRGLMANYCLWCGKPIKPELKKE